jgi:YegS/Rv2252/BmrU family lipid kinase
LGKKNKHTIPFIINPVSGKGDNEKVVKAIKEHLISDLYKPVVYVTKYAGEGTKIAASWAQKGVKRIVAVGGDGTVNEVASALVHTKTALGIIPTGSGNGLARHLHIPSNIQKALRIISFPNIITIDCGMMNDIPFFCTCGMGFDATIGHKFAIADKRGFVTYFRTTVKEFFNYDANKYKLKIDGNKSFKRTAFLVTVANASQYGNNAYIAPTASIQDGKLNVAILKPFPKARVVDLGIKLFRKTIENSPYLETKNAEKITIKRKKKGEAHYDGEPCNVKRKVKIRVIPKALNVIIPYSLNGYQDEL